MRRNATVAQFTIDAIVDIHWASNGAGLSQPNVLIALDRNGVLIECPPRFLEARTCEAQQLLGTETWANPTRITMWEGRLYVLDPAANQLWRYEARGGAYANSPTEYFIGNERPDIREAVDVGINVEGEVFILLSNGNMLKFANSRPLPFGFAAFPEGQDISSAQAMFLNTNPIARWLLIVDQNNRTIHETTHGGSFMFAYRPQDESLFASLSAVVPDTNQRMIYAASGNTILAFDKSQ